MTGSDRLALKSCPESDCRGVFIDPPGRRRWCPNPACASREESARSAPAATPASHEKRPGAA